MNFRDNFSIDPNFTYLNCGTMSLTPKSVLGALDAYRKEYEQNPAHGLLSAWGRLWQVQKELAEFLEANPEDLFFRTNVTYAINDFIFALELPPKSEILVSSLEYGAIVNICRHKAILEGHSVTTLPISLKNNTEEKILQDFEAAISSKTKLAVISHIATGAGLVFPIERMATIARDKGVFFAVDGAHGVGSTPLQFSNTKVDFYGGNLHKWMLGPKGTGFGWVAPRVKKHLVPKFAGWTSYDVQPVFQVMSDPWACRWMISSTHNFADFYGISATLAFWQNHGVEKIRQRQRFLKEYTAKVITQKTGWKQKCEFPSSLDGPMVAFQLPQTLEQKGFNFMFTMKEEYKIQISMVQLEGEWCMRFAPHIYNDESDIELAADTLSKLSY